MIMAALAGPLATRQTPYIVDDVSDIGVRAAQNAYETAPREHGYQLTFTAPMERPGEMQTRKAVAAIERKSREVRATG
jgi:hypothetical protein